MTTENITPAAPDDQDFYTAFAEAAAEAEGKTAAPPADPPADPSAGDPPADPPADDPPKDPPAGDPPADPPKDPPPAPPAPPAPPPAPPAPPPGPPKETPEQIAAREALEASIKPYEPSEAEKSALAKFKVDFPNEYEAVEARLKSVDRDINARVYAAVQDVLKHVDPRLTNVEATASEAENARHVNAIHTAHPDFDTVVDKLQPWIVAQPAHLRPAYQHIYDKGSAQDVIAMVADYKKAIGAPPPAPPPHSTSAPKPKPTGVDDLAPVSSRRVVTSPKGTPDPSDFNAAWKEAVAELG